MLDEEKYYELLNIINKYLEKDKYFDSRIRNIYFDNDNFDLIRKSIDKPIYKQKLRLRCYANNQSVDTVYFEIKKKFKGITNKRRIKASKSGIDDYLYHDIKPMCDMQVLKEIEYIIKRNELKPVLYLAYDRQSYYAKDNKNFRLTFDTNLRFRESNLNIENDEDTTNYFKRNIYILEIKTLDAIPLWFSKALTTLKIYPVSFSKYGKIYENYISKETVKC